MRYMLSELKRLWRGRRTPPQLDICLWKGDAWSGPRLYQPQPMPWRDMLAVILTRRVNVQIWRRD